MLRGRDTLPWKVVEMPPLRCAAGCCAIRSLRSVGMTEPIHSCIRGAAGNSWMAHASRDAPTPGCSAIGFARHDKGEVGRHDRPRKQSKQTERFHQSALIQFNRSSPRIRRMSRKETRVGRQIRVIRGEQAMYLGRPLAVSRVRYHA